MNFCLYSVNSVAQSCPTLHDPMDCSTAGLPVHHQLTEFTQTHVHWVGDAIQPSHLLSPRSLPALLSQHQSLCQWVFVTSGKDLEHQAKYWRFSISPSNEYSGLISFSGLVGSPCSPRDSQESSQTPQLKSINSSALSFHYGPTLTSVHDYWKKYRFDSMDLCWPSEVSAF